MQVYVVTMVDVDADDEDRIPENVGVFESLDGALRFVDERRSSECSKFEFVVFEKEDHERLVHTGGRTLPWAEDWQWRSWGGGRLITRCDYLHHWAIKAVDVQP